MIWKLAKNDFKTKYAGSYLGVLWAFVQPIITVLLYFFVFQIVFQSRAQLLAGGISAPYVVWLTAGLVPWFYFSDVITGGAQTLLVYNYLVKKVVFKIEVLPVVRAISSLFVHGFFVIVLLVMCMIGRVEIHIAWIQILYFSGCLFALVLGLNYLFSAITVFFKDLVQIINIFLQVFMWGSPIMWDIGQLSSHPVLQNILRLNPLYYVVNGYRESLFEHKAFWEHPWLTLYFWVLTGLIYLLGRTVFKRLRPHFADIL